MHNGKLTHYFPDRNTYIYFRHDENEVVMVIINASEQDYIINDWKHFSQCLADDRKGIEILSNTIIKQGDSLIVGAKKSKVIYFK